ncbi:DUF2971 domain-containing protein [Photobacterium sp. GSS17]|uniref:DUF2971 domain-containing protein n=1 Tax=Photobacterium sp. GSS17 TaxID=3020715 RepID=UPI00235F30F3|nr:DUF2971 domain-containing protein [Photobacterium sp. GSS17]
MKVYKYTPHIKLFLESSALKLTPTFQLNDPFEAKITDSFIDNFEIEYKKIFKDNYKGVLPKIKKDLQDLNQYQGVISLSKKPLDILMLSHYASDHTGGILEFEVNALNDGYFNDTNLFDRDHDRTFKFGNVKYNDSRRYELNEDFNEYLSTEVYFDKYSAWKAEKEVRYVSDFRYSDYIIIPKSSLVNSYFEDIKKVSHLDMVSWQIEGDSFYYIFKSYDCDSGEERLYRSKKKKIRSIVGKIFGSNISSYEETSDNVNLKLKCSKSSFFGIDHAISWRTFTSKNCDFHPMIKVNRDALTGIYLGCRFNKDVLNESSLNLFPNLSKNVMQAELCGKEFKLNLSNIFEIRN